MRNACAPSPSNDITASTICSTTRGPAIWPSLVTWPTRMIAAPLILAKRIKAWAEPRTWLTVPGVDSIDVAPHGLDRIDHHQLRPVARAQGGDDILDAGLRGELDIGVGEAEPGGAQAHLRGRFLARDIDDAAALARERSAGLDQQRRFADARFAADQGDRAGDEAAAGDAVEFANAGDDARFRRARRRSALRAERRGRRPCGARGRADAGGDRLLDDRVPFAAGFAFALPALRDRAAILADVEGFRFGHGGGVQDFAGECRETRSEMLGAFFALGPIVRFRETNTRKL